MPDNATTWKLIHAERAAVADTLDGLTAEQWAAPALCAGWSVKDTAAHILIGAEQTGPSFLKGMVANGFRFNVMMDRGVERLGALDTTEIIGRLRARTTTTNHPPAPVMAMLGEIVVHGEDIRRPLGLSEEPAPDAVVACLDMYKAAGFPVGGKKRVVGLRMVATDADWTFGDGPEVSGPAASLLLAMTGRPAGMDGLAGEGLPTFSSRVAG